jgi:hypothetical protein
MESMDKAGDKEERDSSESPFEGADNQSFPSKREEKVRLANKIDSSFLNLKHSPVRSDIRNAI